MRVLKLVVWVALISFLVAPFAPSFAQDETAIASTETSSPLETLVPTEVSTSTVTPYPSDTVTLSPSATSAELPTPTETLQPTSTLVISSQEPTSVIVATPTASSTATTEPEPPLTLLLGEGFDSDALVDWTLSGTWLFATHETGYGIQTTASASPVTLTAWRLQDFAAQVRFRLTGGTFVWDFQQSLVGQYRLMLDSTGQLFLLRGDQVLASASTPIISPDQWQSIRLAVINGWIRVSLNGTEVLAYQDFNGLPPGTLAFSASFPIPEPEQPPLTLLLDELLVWIPTSLWTPSPTLAFTLTPTPSTTEAFSATPTASATILPLEPSWSILHSDTFDPGLLPNWILGTGWSLESDATGAFLQGADNVEPLIFDSQPLYNFAAQMRFHSTTGAFAWDFRKSTIGEYRLIVDFSGEVQLFRLNQLVASTSIGALTPDQWHTARISVMDDFLRVSIDGTEVLTFQDLAPLPPGGFGFSNALSGSTAENTQAQQRLQLDDFVLWIPTDEWSPSATPTVEPTSTIETTKIVLEETTPEVTEEPLPEEPPLELLYSDNFDLGATVLWTLGANWAFGAEENGQSLQTTSSDEVTTFLYDSLSDVVVEATFHFDQGAAQLHARRSEVGEYTLALSNTGEAFLYRNDAVLQQTSIPFDQEWHTLRLSVIDDVLRVFIDDLPLIVIRDPMSLPPGLVGFSGNSLNESVLKVDNFSLWLPASALNPTPIVTATDSPTQALDVLPPEPDLTLLIEDTFDGGDLSAWSMGTGWAFISPEAAPIAVESSTEIASDTSLTEITPEALAETVIPVTATMEVTEFPINEGQAIQAVSGTSPLELNHDPLRNLVVQADLLVASGAAQLNIRQSEIGVYRVVLHATGEVELYRSDTLLRTVTLSSPVTAWKTLRFAAFGNAIQVSIDGVVIMTFLDPEPLPVGGVSIAVVTTAITSEADGQALLDNFKLWIPTAEVPLLPTAVPEPSLQILFGDNFDDGSLRPWMMDTQWRNTYSVSGMAMETWTSNERAQVIDNQLENVAAEVTFYLDQGSISLIVRESEQGEYSALFNASGELSLYRNEELVESGAVRPTSSWESRRLRVSAIDNTVRVSLDGTEIIAFVDEQPLPGGRVSFEAIFDGNTLGSILTVDDVSISIPQESIATISLELPLFEELPEPTPIPESKQEFNRIQSACGAIPYPLTSNWIAYSDWEGTTHGEEIRLNDIECSSDDLGIKIIGRPTTGGLPSQEMDPAISPNGTHIAFDSNCNGIYEIYVLDLASINLSDPHNSFTCSAANRLTDNLISGIPSRDPAWSPDGTRIVFQQYSQADNAWKLWVMDALDGANKRRLTNIASNIAEVEPSWSPDGRQIVFRLIGGCEGVYKANAYQASAATTCQQMQAQSITGGAEGSYRNPAWSPDGKLIAYASNKEGSFDIYVTTPNGRFENNLPSIRLTSGGAWATSVDIWPAWSADMSRIAFTSNYYPITTSQNGAYIHTIEMTYPTGNSLEFTATVDPVPKNEFFWIPNDGPDWSQYTDCASLTANDEDSREAYADFQSSNIAVRRACLLAYRGIIFYAVAHETSYDQYLDLNELSSHGISFSGDLEVPLSHRYLYARMILNGIIHYASRTTNINLPRTPAMNYFEENLSSTCSDLPVGSDGTCELGDRSLYNANFDNFTPLSTHYGAYMSLMPYITQAIHDKVTDNNSDDNILFIITGDSELDRTINNIIRYGISARTTNRCYSGQPTTLEINTWYPNTGWPIYDCNQKDPREPDGNDNNNGYRGPFLFNTPIINIRDVENPPSPLYNLVELAFHDPHAVTSSINNAPICSVTQSPEQVYMIHLSHMYRDRVAPLGQPDVPESEFADVNNHTRIGINGAAIHLHVLRYENNQPTAWVTMIFAATNEASVSNYYTRTIVLSNNGMEYLSPLSYSTECP